MKAMIVLIMLSSINAFGLCRANESLSDCVSRQDDVYWQGVKHEVDVDNQAESMAAERRIFESEIREEQAQINQLETELGYRY